MKDINLFQSKDSIYLKRVKSKSEVSEKDECDGFLIDSSEKEARKIIASLKDKKASYKIGFIGGDDALNRKAIESLKIDYLISPERGDKKDTLKQRDSGINHFVAKLAKEKKISIIININEIRTLEEKERALRLERIIQNIKICRKAFCNIKIASLAETKKNLVDEKGRQSIGVSLGMSSSQSVNSTKF